MIEQLTTNKKPNHFRLIQNGFGFMDKIRTEIGKQNETMEGRDKNDSHNCKKMQNVTYILECNDGSFYTGWTNNLDKRLHAHNAGTASKYTRARRPVKVVYTEAFDTKQEAMRRENQIKRLTRAQKERLVSSSL